jgi:hypothetical protein
MGPSQGSTTALRTGRQSRNDSSPGHPVETTSGPWYKTSEAPDEAEAWEGEIAGPCVTRTISNGRLYCCWQRLYCL